MSRRPKYSYLIWMIKKKKKNVRSQAQKRMPHRDLIHLGLDCLMTLRDPKQGHLAPENGSIRAFDLKSKLKMEVAREPRSWSSLMLCCPRVAPTRRRRCFRLLFSEEAGAAPKPAFITGRCRRCGEWMTHRRRLSHHYLILIKPWRMLAGAAPRQMAGGREGVSRGRVFSFANGGDLMRKSPPFAKFTQFAFKTLNCAKKGE